jgi:hypothetical protein
MSKAPRVEAEPTAETVTLFEDGFEGGTIGEPPPAPWISSGEGGVTAALTDDGPHSGGRCVHITRGPDAPGGWGTLMQMVEAGPYRGRRIRMSAAVRTGPTKASRAQLWLRVDRPDHRTGFFDNMGDRPIVASPEWTVYEISGTVDPDAVCVAFGIIVYAQGDAWLDDVKLMVHGRLVARAPDPPRLLTRRGLDNLLALARLCGYVRFFHPSDEAATADWDRLTVEAVAQVEAARDARGLARALRTVLGPVAPTLQVRLTGEPMAPPAASPAGATAALCWEHRGCGLVGGGIYGSKRRRVSLGRPWPRLLPSPESPLLADLPGGVTCAVPLSVYADRDGTLPRGEPAPARDDSVTVTYSADDRSARLAGVMLAWNVPQHFYPYFDVAGAGWEEALPEALRSAAVDTGEAGFLHTLRRMVARLDDGHGGVWDGSEGALGTPRVLLRWVEGRPVVTHVAPEDEEAVHPGDAVVGVDGEPVEEALTRLEETISSATPQWRQHRLTETLLSGAVDSEVAVELRSPVGETRTVTLERAPAWPRLAEPRPEPVARLARGILYIDLTRVDEAALRAAVPRLKRARGVVFDMRGYPYRWDPAFLGHFIDEPLRSPSWRMPILTRPDHEGMRFRRSHWVIQPRAPRLHLACVTLTDGTAISAAETYMAMIEHAAIGEIVGVPTAGTNGNVNPFAVPGGCRVCWTGLRVVRYDGRRFHGVGIRPSVPVERTIAGVARGEDEVLEAGLRVLRGLLERSG